MLMQANLGESAVRERQIDFILQEEFSLGTEFLQKFLKAASQPSEPGNSVIRVRGVDDVRASVRDQHTDPSSGETDVLVLYRLEGDDPAKGPRALLIENKISAAYQVDQAKRYLLRGEYGVSKLYWQAFSTCLVAPAAYIKDGHGFQLCLSLEDLVPLLAPDSPLRQQFRRHIIERAIEIEKQRGLKQEDLRVTEFRLRYYQAFQEFVRASQEDGTSDNFEGVEASKPRRAWWGDNWFTYRGNAFRNRAYIDHKSERGVVDLTFPNTTPAELKALCPLEPDMSIEKTGKSASIRLQVLPINTTENIDFQLTALLKAFTAVQRLVAYSRSVSTMPVHTLL